MWPKQSKMKWNTHIIMNSGIGFAAIVLQASVFFHFSNTVEPLKSAEISDCQPNETNNPKTKTIEIEIWLVFSQIVLKFKNSDEKNKFQTFAKMLSIAARHCFFRLLLLVLSVALHSSIQNKREITSFFSCSALFSWLALLCIVCELCLMGDCYF